MNKIASKTLSTDIKTNRMTIENSILTDIPKIFELYSIATAYMKSKNQVYWPEFPKELIIHNI